MSKLKQRVSIGSLLLMCSLAFGSVFASHLQSSTQSTHSAVSVVHVNTSTAKQLATLNGVGLKRAKLIVNYRKQHGAFKSLDELTKIKGIGSKSLKNILKKNQANLKL